MMIRAASVSDRRSYPRNDYNGLLHLQCTGEVTWFPVQGVDVSAGGFAFISDYEMRRGERLLVTLPELESIIVGAIVRHVKPMSGGFFVGIEFDEALPPDLERCLCG